MFCYFSNLLQIEVNINIPCDPCMVYRISTYIWLNFEGKCMQICHAWILWACFVFSQNHPASLIFPGHSIWNMGQWDSFWLWSPCNCFCFLWMTYMFNPSTSKEPTGTNKEQGIPYKVCQVLLCWTKKHMCFQMPHNSCGQRLMHYFWRVHQFATERSEGNNPVGLLVNSTYQHVSQRRAAIKWNYRLCQPSWENVMMVRHFSTCKFLRHVSTSKFLKHGNLVRICAPTTIPSQMKSSLSCPVVMVYKQGALTRERVALRPPKKNLLDIMRPLWN